MKQEQPFICEPVAQLRGQVEQETRFHKNVFGYDKEMVDAFIAQQSAALENEKKQAQHSAQQLEALRTFSTQKMAQQSAFIEEMTQYIETMQSTVAQAQQVLCKAKQCDAFAAQLQEQQAQVQHLRQALVQAGEQNKRLSEQCQSACAALQAANDHAKTLQAQNTAPMQHMLAQCSAMVASYVQSTQHLANEMLQAVQ